MVQDRQNVWRDDAKTIYIPPDEGIKSEKFLFLFSISFEHVNFKRRRFFHAPKKYFIIDSY